MDLRLLLGTAGLFAAGALVMGGTHRARRVDRGRVRADWIKYAVYAGVIFLLLIVVSPGGLPAAAPAILVTAFAARELRANLHGRCRHPLAVAAGSSILIAALLAHLTASGAAATVLLTATCDAYSQLWGRLLGRRPLCPRVSPAKTVEGWIGGTSTTVAVALAFGFLTPEIPILGRALLGLAVAGAATAGDLAFSMVKRRLGIKDFATTLPQHGGILDRFDSLILAAPVGYWLQRILTPAG